MKRLGLFNRVPKKGERSPEEIRDEALRRLSILSTKGLFSEVYHSFERCLTRYISVRDGDVLTTVLLSKLDVPSSPELKSVKDFEKKTGNLVYHTMKDNGKLKLFFVERHAETWKDDKSDLRRQKAWVCLLDELGAICCELIEWDVYMGGVIQPVLPPPTGDPVRTA